MQAPEQKLAANGRSMRGASQSQSPRYAGRCRQLQQMAVCDPRHCCCFEAKASKFPMLTPKKKGTPSEIAVSTPDQQRHQKRSPSRNPYKKKEMLPSIHRRTQDDDGHECPAARVPSHIFTILPPYAVHTAVCYPYAAVWTTIILCTILQVHVL